MGTALVEAVKHYKIEIMKKIPLDLSRDDPSALLAECWMCENPAAVQMLLDAGADPNRGEGEMSTMRMLMCSFEWGLDPVLRHRNRAEVALRCIELAAKKGGRWRPSDSYAFRTLRTALAKESPYDAVSHLNRLIKCGAIKEDVFRQLMGTPRMRGLLAGNAPSVLKLRELAGYRRKEAKSRLSMDKAVRRK